MLLEIEDYADAQKRIFGRVGTLHAEANGLKVVLEYLDVLLAAGALIEVAPKPGLVTLAVGDKDPAGVAIHSDEPASDDDFLADALADGEELMWCVGIRHTPSTTWPVAKQCPN